MFKLHLLRRRIQKIARARIRTARKKHLTTLDLGDLNLDYLPGSIRKLHHLRTLILGWNNVDNTNLPWDSDEPKRLRGYKSRRLKGIAILRHLTALEHLDLSLSELLVDFTPLASLTNLRHLDLSWCTSLTDISFTRELHQLEHLSLNGCSSLQSLDTLGRCPVLRTLKLNHCELLHDVDNLSGLPSLCVLELTWCPSLTSVWSTRYLNNLKTLRLTGSARVSEFDPVEPLLEQLSTLELSHTEFADLPFRPEGLYWSSSDVDRLRREFKDRAIHGVVEDHEVKLIILGNGRVGKTSLLKALQQRPHDPQEPPTPGIKLTHLDIPFQPVDEAHPRSARVNIWDFAGQDLYHQTHRLFLRGRAIFLILWDASDTSPWCDDPDDIKRPLQYWVDQVVSVHQQSSLPRILLVRTKTDLDGFGRMLPDWTTVLRPEYHGMDYVACSALTRDGMEEVHRWLTQSVAEELGGTRQRHVPRAIHEIKGLVRACEKPVLSLVEAQKLIASHVTLATTVWTMNEIFQRLHEQGVIYWNPKCLPDILILDQPWALDGIYVLFQKASPHREKLLRRRGSFAASDLAIWFWNQAGISETKQRILMALMMESGMCFELLTKHEADAREAVYVLPEFLPDKADVARDLDLVNGELLSNPSVSISAAHNFLGPDPILRFLCCVGNQWSRAAHLWRYGALFKSASGTWAILEWERESADSYGGTMTLKLFGHEVAFLQHIIVELKLIPDFPASAWQTLQAQFAASIDAHDDDADSAPQRASKKRKGRATQKQESGADSAVLLTRATKTQGGILGNALRVYQLPRLEQTGARIGLSFAGEDENHPGIDAFPKLLGQSLRKEGLDVLDYKVDDNSPDLERFLRELVVRDCLVVFLSRKFLYSTYCMWELLQIFRRLPDEQVLSEQCELVWFPDARLVDAPSGASELDVHSWTKRWRDDAARISRYHAENSPMDAISAKLHLDNNYLNEWYVFIRSEENGLRLAKALLHSRLAVFLPHTLGPEEMEESSKEVTRRILRRARDTRNLCLFMRRAWQSQDFDHAVKLFYEFLEIQADELKLSEDELLSRDWDDPVVNQISAWCWRNSATARSRRESGDPG